jgi:DNA adenine methylase
MKEAQAKQTPEVEKKSSQPQPFLKWAGGKRQLLHVIRSYIPRQFKTYYEPFVGAGAVLFDLRPDQAVINDINEELINCYRVIKESPEALLKDVRKHRNEKEYFYSIRALDRSSNYKTLSPVERASRVIYLNKSCYNGLYRVNSKGEFNTPFGRYKNPQYVQEETILAISRYLNRNSVEIKNTSFDAVVETAEKDDFIYFDPPYDPVSETASFTSYSLSPFGRKEQVYLKETADLLGRRGCKVMLSNSATEYIQELYKEYYQIRVPASRSINSVGSSRGKIDELLILNYEPGRQK